MQGGRGGGAPGVVLLASAAGYIGGPVSFVHRPDIADEEEGTDLVGVALASSNDPDSIAEALYVVGFGDILGEDDDDSSDGSSDEHALSLRTVSEDLGALDVDLSPWAPLLSMVDSTEPEECPGDRPFTAAEGAGGAHALELRAESMLLHAGGGAERTGALDCTEVAVDGMLDEHTGHGLVVIADDVEANVEGSLTMHAHLEDNVIMAGVIRDEFAGGTLITAAMSDDLVVGAGLRCTAPLDGWVHGLVGMEEHPGTCAADGILNELAGTLYEREYGPSMHVAAVARFLHLVVKLMVPFLMVASATEQPGSSMSHFGAVPQR